MPKKKSRPMTLAESRRALRLAAKALRVGALALRFPPSRRPLLRKLARQANEIALDLEALARAR